MLRGNNLVRREIELGLRGGGADLGLRPDQHGDDELGAGRVDGAEQGRRVDRMNDRSADWIEPAGRFDQEFIAPPFLPQFDLRQEDART